MATRLETLPSRQVEWITPTRLLWFGLVIVSLTGGLCLLLFPPIYVAAAMGAIVGAVLLFFYPFLGALAYLVFEYARVSAMYPVLIPLQVGKLLVAAMLISLLANGLVTGRLKFVSDRVNWVMLGWVLLAFASIATAMRTDMALAGAIDLAKWALIFLLIVNLVTTYGRWQWFAWAFVLLNLKLSQFQLRAYSYGLQQATNKDFFITQGAGAGSTSFLGNATDFGAAMCVVVPFAVYMMRCSRWKPLRILGLIAAAFFVLSIVRTGSRGAAVALFAMAAVYWWKSRHKAPVALAVVGLVIAMWIITPQASRERFISATNYEEDATASSRLDFWEAGLKMFVKHPLTGVGMHNFAYNYQAGGGIKIVPHSIFIQAASELGVPGITILLALLYIIFKRNRESRRLAAAQGRTDLRAFADALDLSLVGFIVSGAFLTILYYPHIFMILAMTISLNQIAKKNAPVHAEIENVTAPRRTDRESV